MFSFSSSDGPANDGSAIGNAIEQATDSMLMHADWSKNLEICDLIESTPGGPTSAVRCLRKQLRAENTKTVELALELSDACVKNTGANMHAAVATKAFMNDVVALTEGKKGWPVREEALKCIQQWALELKNFPVFQEIYVGLKTKGVAFPEADNAGAPINTPQSFSSSSSSSDTSGASRNNSAGTGGEPVATPDTTDAADIMKLREDLHALSEKIKLCKEMLPESPGIEQDETLAEVVGFLEACQPRMVDLIEAGMQGMLGEELFSFALHVNDDLNKTLEAEKNGTPLPISDASFSTQNNGSDSASSLWSSSTPPPPPMSTQGESLLDPAAYMTSGTENASSNNDHKDTEDLSLAVKRTSLGGDEEELSTNRGARRNRGKKMLPPPEVSPPSSLTVKAEPEPVTDLSSGGALHPDLMSLTASIETSTESEAQVQNIKAQPNQGDPFATIFQPPAVIATPTISNNPFDQQSYVAPSATAVLEQQIGDGSQGGTVNSRNNIGELGVQSVVPRDAATPAETITKVEPAGDSLASFDPLRK